MNVPKSRKLAWCRTASVDSNGRVSLETIADGFFDSGCIRDAGSQSFDLTSSVDWMEYLEKMEGRENDEGGAGAYDTMRCDIILSNGDGAASRKRVSLWGQDYHMKRLEQSYFSLFQEKHKLNVDKLFPSYRVALKDAAQKSNLVISKLVDEAEASSCLVSEVNDTVIQLFRVTLLWSNNKSTECEFDQRNVEESIVVRGHATSSCIPLNVHRTPEPIVVSVAAHSKEVSTKTDEIAIDKSLPTRFSNPQNKIASWCRLRKQLEKPSYKPPDASEVLMVRSRLDERNTTRLEVLEGLSSNFFAIYKDGSLRTATEGVLNGYVRHLVLVSANKVGLMFDPRPIYLHEAGQWSEAFITSSSRLIWPVSKVLLPDDSVSPSGEVTFTEHWKYELEGETASPKWHDLLEIILKEHGYKDL